MIIFKDFNLREFEDRLIVTDKHIGELYDIAGENVYFLPEGEQAKSFACVERLCQWFLSKNLKRGGQVVAVGGGSIGDAVGFAASIYKRGVSLTHVPTTLVAQIDSSIGGKTALDIDGTKNAVGTFYSADTVIDVNFLQTLDKEQMTNGLGELIKYRMLSDKINEVSSMGDVEQTIKACVEYKSEICAVDPYDRSIRRKLNFGHTIGHAMELALNISHGQAVANGICYETILAYKLGKCDERYRNKWTQEIADSFKIYPLSDEILRLTLSDKKNDGNGVSFVLPSDFDSVTLSLNEVISLLK